MVPDLVARELRRLRRLNVEVARRVALVNMPGKVQPGSQDMDRRTVRLVLAKTADGTEILSAPVRWQQPGAGALQTHAVPKDGEQMYLHSPSGTHGGGSLAVWGTYDDDTKPPSDAKDAAVMRYGKATQIEMRDDYTKTSIGDLRTVVKTDKYVKLKVGDALWIVLDKVAGKILSSHPIVVGPDPDPQL